jgi:hypothetical protein
MKDEKSQLNLELSKIAHKKANAEADVQLALICDKMKYEWYPYDSNVTKVFGTKAPNFRLKV